MGESPFPTSNLRFEVTLRSRPLEVTLEAVLESCHNVSNVTSTLLSDFHAPMLCVVFTPGPTDLLSRAAAAAAAD